MRIESSYPAPVMGISTLAPRNRVTGQAGKQINFRSDPVNKLTRRPPVQWGTFLLSIDPGTSSEDIIYHQYRKDNHEFRFVLDTNAKHVYIFIDDVLEYSEDIFANWSSYVTNDVLLQTVEDVTYILNPTVKVARSTKTDATEPIPFFERVSHINVTTALNYGETVQVNVTKSNGSRHTVTYTVPDLGITDPDYDTADKARATKQVALELAARINGGGTHDVDVPNPDYAPTATVCYDQYDYTLETTSPDRYSRANNPNYDPSDTTCQPFITTYSGITGVTAAALGSSVAVWEDGREDWLDLEVETGQGDRSCVAVNQTIERTDGLPLYAVVGTRITVKPDPTSEKGTYYLQAQRTADGASGEDLEEVVWSESRTPIEPHRWDDTTLPLSFRIREIPSAGSDWTIQQAFADFKDRSRGDDDSNPPPAFLDNTISNIGYFQKRLVFLSGNNVSMSEVDDPDNFWLQSAVQLLVSDRIEIASSATSANVLRHVLTHNKDLFINAADGQYKIDGSAGITPQTVSMTRTTSYESQISVPPVSMGNSVYIPINYGTSTGIQEYSSERDTGQDHASQLTRHIVGYMEGVPKILAASSNLEMLALVTDVSGSNKLFIYDQFTDPDSGKKLQRSWSEWVLPTSTEILSLSFQHDKLSLITRDDGEHIVVKEIDMYSQTATGTNEVFLDDLLKLSTDGLTATLPSNYNTTDMVVIQGDGTDYEFNEIGFTLNGSTVTLSEDIGAGSIYVGKLFESRYQPTRPFAKDENGVTITTDKLRVGKYILSLVDTNEIKMSILSDFYSTDDQVFNSRYLGGLNNLVGKIPFFTGDFKFSFSQDADLALAEFYCDNHLGCTIAGISWEGQYYKSKGRM